MSSAARDIVITISALMPSLAPAEKRVAQLAVEDPGGVAALTISALAERARTSSTTVIRFCRAVGLDGYPALRISLAAAAGHGAATIWREVSGDIGPDDMLDQLVRKIGNAHAGAIADTLEQLDLEVLQHVVDDLLRARRIDVYGVGASGLVALDFQQKLYRIGRVAYAWTDAHMALTSAAILASADVAVAISYTGTTIDTYEPSRLARANGATLVAITNHPKSPLARLADRVLATAARETTFRSGAMTSRVAQLAIVDCLFAAVAQRNYEATLHALERTYAAISLRRRPSQS